MDNAKLVVTIPEGYTPMDGEEGMCPPYGIYVDFITRAGNHYEGCTGMLGSMPPNGRCCTVFVIEPGNTNNDYDVIPTSMVVCWREREK